MTQSPLPVSRERVEGAANKLWRLERLLDEALSLSGELTSDLALGRLEAGLCATVGHNQVFGELPAIGASLVAARGGAVKLHQGLAAVSRRFGLTTMSPPVRKDEPSFAPFQDEPSGRVHTLETRAA